MKRSRFSAGALPHFRVGGVDEVIAKGERPDVRLDDEAVVDEGVFRALDNRLALRLVPAHRHLEALIENLAVGPELFELALDFVVACVADRLERVHILDFGDRRAIFLAVLDNAQVDVRVAAHRAFLEISVGRADVLEDFADRLHEKRGFFRTRHIRLRNDLDQRNSRAVVVNVAVCAFDVEALADVSLEMDALDADLLEIGSGVGSGEIDHDVAVRAERKVVLRDLIAFDEVGIEIVLAVELRKAGNLAVESEAGNRAELDILAARDRHGAGQSETDGAHAGIRHAAVAVFAGAERLRLRQ